MGAMGQLDVAGYMYWWIAVWCPQTRVVQQALLQICTYFLNKTGLAPMEFAPPTLV